MKKVITLLILSFFSWKNAYGLITVDITRGNLDPLPIAVSPLHVDSKSEKFTLFETLKLGAEISKIVEKNFKGTGLFNPLKKDSFVQKPDIAHLKPSLKIGV